MKVHADDLGYHRTWQDFKVEDYEGYTPNMNHLHSHSYYEISLILRGNVTVLLGDMADTVTADGSEGRLLLIAPSTPHFIIPEQGVLYARRNLLRFFRKRRHFFKIFCLPRSQTGFQKFKDCIRISRPRDDPETSAGRIALGMVIHCHIAGDL